MNEKLKPKMKIADDYFDLRTLDTNITIEYLEEQIKLREASVEKKLSRLLKQ